MLYIHQTTCISAQQTFPNRELETLHDATGNKLLAIEPSYEGIPKSALRRMSKPVRMGVGAALPITGHSTELDGIIIGTANAGMEDCFHFLKQMVEYNEGLLTPGNFVQSTPNALAGQLGMLKQNKGYNITHVHLGLAFENALLDAVMRLEEYPTHNYLLGAVDDISVYNYAINLLDGRFKAEQVPGTGLYNSGTPGTIPGEGATMFLVNTVKENSLAKLVGLETIHSKDEAEIAHQLKIFIDKSLPANETISLLISGENGDSRLMKFYTACEDLLPATTGIVRYKHMSGEYPTAVAMALWIACGIFQKDALPAHMIKKEWPQSEPGYILIYNNFKGAQHSFILLSNPA
ncbi:MAG: beta-ketoacyl synthase chain length factor [Ferruginibacter sp.]